MRTISPKLDTQGYRLRLFSVTDLPEVVGIEAATAVRPWTAADFREWMTRADSIGHVVEADGRVAGFAVVSRDAVSLTVRRLTVSPGLRRRQVGSALIRELQRTATDSERLIRVEVPADSLAGQLFLRRHGFECVAIETESVRATGHDEVYRFLWSPYRRWHNGSNGR